jgi:hypothetical protein
MASLEDRVAALEVEVRRLNDHLAIQKIISRYGPFVDCINSTGRVEKFAEYYGADMIYDISDKHKFNGADFARSLLTIPSHQDYVTSGSTHVMAFPYILVDGDRATALGYSHVIKNAHDGTFTVVRSSVNYWEFSRDGGNWRIVRRTNRPVDGTDEAYNLMHRVDAQDPAL